MAEFSVITARVERAAGAGVGGGGAPPWAARLIGAVVLLIGAAVALVVVVPLLVLAVLAAAGLGVYGAVRAWWRRLRSPNGALDGRRNVRVRVPEDAA